MADIPELITSIVAGKPRYRFQGIILRRGQTPEKIDATTRAKIKRAAKHHGLDIKRFTEWWFYTPEENGPPEHQIESGRVKIIEGDRGGKEYRSYSDPLAFYERSGHISELQHRAGTRIYAIWRSSNMLSRYRVMRYDDSRGAFGPPDAKALLNPIYREAMDAITDERSRNVVFAVCCEGHAAGRGRVELLRQGLDDLATHFRLDKRKSI